MVHCEYWSLERVGTAVWVLPRVPRWGAKANSGLTVAVLTGGAGPRYLSVGPDLHCSTNAVKFKMTECLVLPLFSVPKALRFPHW